LYTSATVLTMPLGNRCSIRSWHLIAEHSSSRFGGQAAFAYAFGSEFSVKRPKLDRFSHFLAEPSAAARTAKDRVEVVDSLKTLENHKANLGRDDEMTTYNFNWLWTVCTSNQSQHHCCSLQITDHFHRLGDWGEPRTGQQGITC
jgi:hypothetical protein